MQLSGFRSSHGAAPAAACETADPENSTCSYQASAAVMGLHQQQHVKQLRRTVQAGISYHVSAAVMGLQQPHNGSNAQ